MKIKDIGEALDPLLETEGLPAFHNLQKVTFNRRRDNATFEYIDGTDSSNLINVTKSYEVPLER